MSLDDRTAQEKLTPSARRTLLRAFADRMLLKVSAMDDPEDMPGVEKAVRVAAAIERIYYRCDRAETHTPDPRKLEAERATNQSTAIKARVSLAGTLKWGEDRRQDLGKWWDAAQEAAQAPVPAPVVIPATAAQSLPQAAPLETIETLAAQGVALHERLAVASGHLPDDVIDYTDCILQARRDLGLPEIPEDELEDWPPKPPPPSP